MVRNYGLCLGVFVLSFFAGAAAGDIDDGFKNPAVAADPNVPKFIVVYSGHYQEEECIWADLYDFSGGLTAVDGFIRVDSTHNGHPADPDIAMNRDTVFIVWTSSDGSDEGIKGRIFDPNLVALTAEFSVNSTTAGTQCEPAVAVDASGRGIVVWTNGTPPNRTIVGRLFGADGLPLTSEFTVAAGGDNFSPAVCMDPNGLIGISWSVKPSSPLPYRTVWRQYRPDGSPKTNAMILADDLVSSPATCIDCTADRIVIAWDADTAGASQSDIYARVYDPNGNPQTATLAVNTFTAGRQERPSAALFDSGRFVIVWQSENADGSDYGICGRLYDPNGLPEGDESLVNLYAYRKQHKPDVSVDNTYFQFFSAWQSDRETCYYPWGEGELECEYYHTVDINVNFKPHPDQIIACGDVSGNGFVDMTDLLTLAEHWLQWGYIIGQANPDRYPDGHIDMRDFLVFGRSWMQCCASYYASVYTPEMMAIYNQTRLIYCNSKMRRIGIAIRMYYDDEGNYPQTLTMLLGGDYFESPWPEEQFQCPAVCPHTQVSDYVYRGADLFDWAPRYMVVLYDRQYNHTGDVRNVCFLDGIVETMSEADFVAAIALDNAYRNASPRLEVKPIE